jgi:hypothetical protein
VKTVKAAHKEDKMSVIEERLNKAEQEADELWQKTYAEDAGIDAKPENDKTGDKPAVIDEGEGAPVDGIVAKDEGKPEDKGIDTPAKKDEDADGYKQKFQVLEGKYKAEVPRLSAELAQWKEFATSLQQRLTTLEETVKAKPPIPEKEDAMEDDYEVEAFVQDNPGAAKMIAKIKEEHKAELASLRDEIKSVDQKSVATKSEFQKTVAVDRFDKAMADKGVPEWRTIDVDPAFMEWLKLSPYNLKVLQEAASSFDVDTVSSYFLDYKKSIQPTDNGGEPSDNGDGMPNKLEKFTAPPRSGGGGPPSKSAQTALTLASYSKFMAETTKGNYNPNHWGGKTEVQMDAMFDAAIAKNALR